MTGIALSAALAVACGVAGTGCVAKIETSRENHGARLTAAERRAAALETSLVELERRQERLESDMGNQVALLRDQLRIEIGAVTEARAAAVGEADGDGEGAAAAAAGGDPAAELVRRLAADGVTLDREKKRVAVSGVVAAPDAPLEFAATTERGKTHETLLILKCKPSALNAGLIALGLVPGRPFEIKEEVTEEEKKTGTMFQVEDFDTKTMHDLWYFTPRGPRVAVTVAWTEGEKRVTRRIEEMIYDLSTEAPMEKTGFVYLGSRMDEDRDGREVYVADFTGDLIAVYHSFQGNTLLDTPLLQGRDDTVFVARRDAIPPRGTPVDVAFEAVADPPPAGPSPKR